MMRALLALMMTASIVTPASSAPDAAVGAAYPHQYLPREVVVVQGGGLVFIGSDSEAHDLESYDVDEQGLPLFSTYGPVPFGGSARVQGVEQLEPGPYIFICNLHDRMTGRLVVQSLAL